jgi:hypothetical protein
MRLYSGMSKDFIRDTVHNQITDKLSRAFFGYYRYKPSPSEIGSWRNSLRAMALTIKDARLVDQEWCSSTSYRAQSVSTVCCVAELQSEDRAVLVEQNSQWDACEESEVDDVVVIGLAAGAARCSIVRPSRASTTVPRRRAIPCFTRESAGWT